MHKKQALPFYVIVFAWMLFASAQTDPAKQDVIRSWPAPAYQPFKKAEKKILFYGTDLYRLDSVLLKGKTTHRIDSFMALKLLKYENVLPSATYIYGTTLQRNWYYSIDKPVNGFYPVTLIVHEKESMRNLTMYLLDKKGTIKSHFKLAFRGNTMRLRTSPLNAPNDSTLTFSAPVFNQSYSQRTDDSTFHFFSISHRMNYDVAPPVRVTHFADKYIIVHKDGKVETKEGKSWKE